MQQFEVNFEEFMSKLVPPLKAEGSSLVLNYRILEETGYEFWVSFQGYSYHCIVTEADLDKLYRSNTVDRNAMFRMFKQEVIESINSVWVK